MNRWAALLGVALAFAVVIAAVPASTERTSSPPNDAVVVFNAAHIESASGDIVRFNDDEAGVTCWLLVDSSVYAGQGGLSCLPTNETDLGP